MNEAPPAGKRIRTRPRVGAEAMTLLAAPLNVQVLRALRLEPSPLRTLRRAVGSPPQSTMRLYLRTLSGVGVIERTSRQEFPTSVDYAITRSGQQLLEVGKIVERWLERSPTGPLDLGSVAARNAIKPLVEGWSTNIVRALAARSLSLTELDRLIPKVSYPSLERRLGALSTVGLVEGRRVEGVATPYVATEWLRRSIVPLVAAGAWERRFLLEPAPVGRFDVETAFLLAISLIELPGDLTGRCRLSVEVQGGTTPVFAGVLVRVEEGRVTACAPNLNGEVEGWVTGTPDAWIRRFAGDSPNQELELGGEVHFAEAIVQGLMCTLKKPR